MARIILTDSLSKKFTDGKSDFEIVAPSVRSLIRELDNRYPGLGTQISDGTLSVAIDGGHISGRIFRGTSSRLGGGVSSQNRRRLRLK